ncbi:MAG TPA: GNAT family N-acetyltransferase, partial [Candidatus Manganitrophaceae bacterium]|nr:GNAT family N-acetyltransferase [Candidatus Manganitrophaceae bacterium]
MIQIEEITRFDAFEALSSEWSDLLDRCPTSTPFQSPEWILPWWRHFGGGSLWVLALRREGRLVGLAPFFIHPVGEKGIKQVALIGTGITDYLDLILQPDAAFGGTEAILNRLALHRAEWDLCDFQELRPSSFLLAFPASNGLQLRSGFQEVCPALSLPDTQGEFQIKFSPEHRRNIRNARKRLEAAGELAIETASEATLPEFLEALFALHRARWEERRLPGVLADSAVQAFHREAAAGFQKRGCLRLYALRSGGKIAAALYAFAWRGRMYGYLGGFRPEMARFSPGTVLIDHVLEAAIGEKLREFDFLRGREAY